MKTSKAVNIKVTINSTLYGEQFVSRMHTILHIDNQAKNPHFGA